MAMSSPDVHGEVNGKSVQDRLIEAAEDLLCRRGFNETSVRDIASAAGCNVASVNYYFGGKESLYLEIWRRRLAQIRETRLASINKVMSAEGRVVKKWRMAISARLTCFGNFDNGIMARTLDLGCTVND